MTRAFEKFNSALKNNNGKAVYNLSDAESHLYFSQLLRKTRTLDSISLQSQSDFNRMNVMMARGLLSDSLLYTASSKDFMTALYDTKSFDLLYKMTQNSQFEISWMAIKKNQAEVTLVNDKVIYLNKENDSWKVNMPSLMKLSNTLLKKSTSRGKSNGMNKSTIIHTYIKGKISNDLVKPFEYVYWPVGVKENEDFFNNKFYFSSDISCANQIYSKQKSKAKILIFTDYTRVATDFHNKFIESDTFKSFVSNNFDFILLTEGCKTGKEMFEKYEIRNIPTILFVDEIGAVQNKQVGYIITPEMYMEESQNKDILKEFLNK